jgi:hypothetical protein
MRLLCRQYTISPILIVFDFLIEQGLLINNKILIKIRILIKIKIRRQSMIIRKKTNEPERGKIKSYTKRKK